MLPSPVSIYVFSVQAENARRHSSAARIICSNMSRFLSHGFLPLIRLDALVLNWCCERQSVSLDRLVEERKKNLQGSFQVNPGTGPSSLIWRGSACWCSKLHHYIDAMVDVMIDVMAAFHD